LFKVKKERYLVLLKRMF